ncbi:hypothetical protein HYH03_007440 [Edaphochlamys debaryana]|uniref:Uncharacterized protein n=1 Tax=Edaphochlamys debaryana TaxID=47281 RepID=A0A835Y1V1_9CHLO|nr:hypothetical protein HYH03_007440 [Edaphochlamys debaryana]|eukprot:KAG2494386.1 hypothetical protein HYH03_007440 [Edaphochlamys debaryana]
MRPLRPLQPEPHAALQLGALGPRSPEDEAARGPAGPSAATSASASASQPPLPGSPLPPDRPASATARSDRGGGGGQTLWQWNPLAPPVPPPDPDPTSLPHAHRSHHSRRLHAGSPAAAVAPAGASAADPRDGAVRRFREQTYDTFRPMPTLYGALAVMAVLVAVGLGLGVPLLLAAHQAAEVRVPYDDAPPLGPFGDPSGGGAGGLVRTHQDAQSDLASAGDAGVRQVLELPPLRRRLRPPVYVLYELSGLYGTHKRYVRSVSRDQLAGETLAAGELSTCEPRLWLGGGPNASLPDRGLINPCGLRAASLFNDTYALAADPATCGAAASGADVSSSGSSGGGLAVAEPEPATTLPSPSSSSQATTAPPSAAAPYAPLPLDRDAVAWPLEARRLYGMYNATNLNTQPASREGGALAAPVRQATDLHVWMRPPSRPTALKLYGIIDKELPAGCRLRLAVANRYDSYAWGGSKTVVLSSQSWYGMSNTVLPAVLLSLAGLGAAGAALLLVLAAVWRRVA